MSEQNKNNARAVLKSQMERAINMAAIYENAGQRAAAAASLNDALFLEEALRRLEEVPAELCEPDPVRGRVTRPAVSGTGLAL